MLYTLLNSVRDLCHFTFLLTCVVVAGFRNGISTRFWLPFPYDWQYGAPFHVQPFIHLLSYSTYSNILSILNYWCVGIYILEMQVHLSDIWNWIIFPIYDRTIHFLNIIFSWAENFTLVKSNWLIFYHFFKSLPMRFWWAFLVAQMVKGLPAMRETRVRSLGWEDPLEKEMATHSRIHAWKIPWTEEPGGLQSMGSQRVGHDWVTSVHFSSWGFQGLARWLNGKESACQAGDMDSIPG